MEWIRRFWNHHIPFHDVNQWISGAVYGAAVYFILVVMQPFCIDRMGNDRFVMMIPYFFVTWIGCVLPSYILPLLRKDFFHSDKWNRGRLFIYLISIAALISFGNMMCFVLTLGAPMTWEVAWVALWQTLAIGVVIFGIGLMLPEKRHEKEEDLQKQNSALTIKGTGKSDLLSLELSDLLYVESDRNYCNIVMSDKSVVMRSTIASIEEQLSSVPQVKRCHRAYLVNTENILTIDGNSTAGYRLIMNGGLHIIPLARQYAKDYLLR